MEYNPKKKTITPHMMYALMIDYESSFEVPLCINETMFCYPIGVISYHKEEDLVFFHCQIYSSEVGYYHGVISSEKLSKLKYPKFNIF